MPRPRVDAQLQRIGDHRITTVVAGSGYGKTAALTAWASATGPAWYTVGPEDVDAARLVGGLLAALRRRLPALPDDLVAAAASALGPDAHPRHVEPTVVALTEALDLTVTDDVALVMDDVHHLVADSPGARLLEGLCRQSPAALHVVLASRVSPVMPLQRLRGQGQVLELDGRLLAFTIDETAALTEMLLGPGSEAVVEPLQALTEGWPAAVRLALATLEQAPAAGRAAALDSLRGPGGAIRAYLHDEAIGQEAPLAREALWTLATVGQADAAILGALGVADADRVLADLQHRGLVVAAVDQPGAFRTSQVVHDAIDDAWHPEAGRRVATLRAAATANSAAGRHDHALGLLVAAEDHDAVIAMLDEHGGGVLAQGYVGAVLAAVNALPAERLTAEAALVAGEASQVRGDWEGALGWFRAAAAPTGELPAGLAWRMGLIYHLRGELAAADAIYARGRLDGSAPRDEALLLGWRSSVNWLLGRAKECRTLAAQAHELAQACNDDEALAAAHTTQAMLAALDGDRRANDAHYRSALAFARRSGNVLQRIRIHCNRGSHLLEEGAYQAAVDELEHSIRLAELTGYAALHGLALTNRADALLRLGCLDDALAGFTAAHEVLQAISSWLAGYALRGLADIRALRGSTALARASYEEAVAIADAAGDVQGLVPALAGLARLLAEEDPERAAALAERALSCGTGTGYVAALLATGWVATSRGDSTAAVAHAERAAEVARSRRDRAGLAEALELRAAEQDPVEAAGLLRDSHRIWTELAEPVGAARTVLALDAVGDRRADVEQALSTLGDLGIRAEDSAAVRARPGVVVDTLGGFRVHIDGVAVPGSAWQSRKARDLFKMLLARRGRATPREVLTELLWPQEDPSRLSSRLSVALSTARAVLDPEHRWPADHFLPADRDTIALDHLTVDVETFLTTATDGLEARRAGRSSEATDLLLRAERAYTGDFLHADPYEDWAAPLREEVRATAVAILSALADDAVQQGAWDRAVRHLLRLLTHDAYDERAHLRLVESLAQSGRYGEAHRRYNTYTQRMAELDVEPVAFPDVRSGR